MHLLWVEVRQTPNIANPQALLRTDCSSPAKSQNRYSLQSLCAAGHMAWLRQAWQRGRTGRQVCWPKPTKSPLISLHRFLWVGMGKFGGRKGEKGVLPHPHTASAPGQPLLQGSAGLLWGLGHLLGPLESVGDSVHMCVHCCLEMGQDKPWHTSSPRLLDPCLWPHPEPRLVGSLSLPGFPPCTVLATGMSRSPGHPCSWAGAAASTQRTWVLHLGYWEQSLLAQPLVVGARLSGSNSDQPVEPAPATALAERVQSTARPAAAVFYLD